MRRTNVAKRLAAWVSLASIVAFPGGIMASSARQQRAGAYPGEVVYQAGGAHSWVGWRAPGWNVQHGVLVGHPGLNEINVPFVPGRHGIRNYELLVVARTGPPDLSGSDRFSFYIRRVRRRGCSFDVQTGEFGVYGISAHGKWGRLIELDSVEARFGRTETYQLQVFGHDVSADVPTESADGWVDATCRAGSRNGFLSVIDWSVTRLVVESVKIMAM